MRMRSQHGALDPSSPVSCLAHHLPSQGNPAGSETPQHERKSPLLKVFCRIAVELGAQPYGRTLVVAGESVARTWTMARPSSVSVGMSPSITAPCDNISLGF